MRKIDACSVLFFFFLFFLLFSKRINRIRASESVRFVRSVNPTLAFLPPPFLSFPFFSFRLSLGLGSALDIQCVLISVISLFVLAAWLPAKSIY